MMSPAETPMTMPSSTRLPSNRRAELREFVSREARGARSFFR